MSDTKTERCPTCGAECTVAGTVTKWYVPVASDLKQQLAERDAALARCVEALDYVTNTPSVDAPTYIRNVFGVCMRAKASLPTSAQATAKVQQWQPIETYDKLKKKPRLSVFWFKELKPLWSNGIGLSACASLDRVMGSRICTHWMPLPEPPEAIREEKEWK